MRSMIILVFASLTLLAGCGGATKLSYPVGLAYRGPEQKRATPLGAKPPRLLVAPFEDSQPGRRRLGEYRMIFLRPVEFRVPSDDVAAHVGRIVSDLFRKLGYEIRPGRWDGDAQSLPKLDADFALWGRVEAFKATGTGTLYDTRREMVVRITMKMGSKARGHVRTRVVEVTPKDRFVHFLAWGFDHYGAMANFMNNALSLALERTATELAGRAAKP